MNGVLTLNLKSTTDNEFTVVGYQKPSVLTLDDETSTTGEVTEDDPIFGSTDDGFDRQRESLLKARVASLCMLMVPGRDAMYRANNLEGRAARIEHEMEGVRDILMSSEIEVLNETEVMDIE